MQDRPKLRSVYIAGFKSIDPENGQFIRFGDVTVLLGANGAGKSNLVSFFQMLHSIRVGELDSYVAASGLLNSLFYFGREVTDQIEIVLNFGSSNTLSQCQLRLLALANGLLLPKYGDGPGRGDEPLSSLPPELPHADVFQFHDTSSKSGIRHNGYVNDNKNLRGDGANLAAFLYAMQSPPENKQYYERIIRRIREVMPQFDDFVLAPLILNPEFIPLDWTRARPKLPFQPAPDLRWSSPVHGAGHPAASTSGYVATRHRA